MIDSVDPSRLRDLTLELVEVESPTGDTAAAAQLYAERLREAGMEVELLDEQFPATPIVVGRLAGGLPGPRIVLNGHLDTVPIPHAPPRIDGDLVRGRGSADMKGACVCALEAVRIAGGAPPVPGRADRGRHRAARGAGRARRGSHLAALGGRLRGRPRRGLRARIAHPADRAHGAGDRGDHDHAIRGWPPTSCRRRPAPRTRCSSPRAWWRRSGGAPRSSPRPSTPGSGAETYFVGEIHGGDFYNRHAASCRVVGTRRWAPGNSLAAVREEFEALLAPIAEAERVTIDLDLRLVRDAYGIDPEHPLVRALQAAYEDETGRPLEPQGLKVVADGAVFQAVGGIPTVYHGPGGNGAHADEESMPVDELVRATRVYLRLLERLWADA